MSHYRYEDNSIFTKWTKEDLFELYKAFVGGLFAFCLVASGFVSKHALFSQHDLSKSIQFFLLMLLLAIIGFGSCYLFFKADEETQREHVPCVAGFVLFFFAFLLMFDSLTG